MINKPPHMDIYQIVSLLNQKNIRIWQEQGRLCYSAKEGAMTEAITELLRNNKQALLDFLQKPQATNPIVANTQKPEQLDLSFAQQRIWYASQLAGNDNSFLINSAFLLEGSLNINALEQSSHYLGSFFKAINQRFFATEQGPKQQSVSPDHRITTIAGFSDIVACLENAPEHYQFNLSQGALSQTLLYPLSATRHVIIFALHHIVADAHSMALLAKGLSHCYQAFSQGKQPNLPTPSFDYGDYILWQQEQQHSPKWQQQLAFWQQQLQIAPSQCLPIISSPRPIQAKSFELIISAQQTAELQKLAASENASLFMLLQALLAASLSVFSQEPTIAIGNPVAGRQQPGLEEVFGCFINLVVWQQSIDSQQDFKALLQQSRQTTLATLANQDVPFEQVVKTLNPERDALSSPLFQVLFNLQEQNHYQQTVDDLTIKALTLELSDSPYPLSVDANLLQNGNLQLQWLYRADLLPEGFTEQLSQCFNQLGLFVVNNPNANLDDFNHQQSLANNWVLKGKKTAVPTKNLADYINQSASLHAEKLAIIDQQQSFSYQQLHDHSNALAHQWQQQSITRIAICLPEGYLAIVAMVAAVKAGVSFVPFTYDTGHGFLAQCLEQVPVDFIVSDAAFCKAFTAVKTLKLSLNALTENSPAPKIINDNNPSFAVLFTSGSSGQPKAAELKQQAVINRLVWMQATFKLNPGDTILQKTAYSFDVSLWEIFWPLMFAGTLISAKADERFNSQRLSQLITQHQIRFCHFVPSMLQQFLQFQSEPLPTLEAVIASGEVLDSQLQKRFFNTLTSSKLYNLYGPTEAAIDVSFHQCQEHQAPSLGQAIDNCQIAITNGRQQLLPPFAIGQITLAGSCLSEGYLNVNNDSAFALHKTLGRCYYTGDLGFIDNQQQLHFIARADNQLKVRGVRINPEQIEQALLQQSNIEQAKLLVSQQRLWLFYTGQYYPEADLQNFLQHNLPSLMQPQRICHTKQWPRLKSGKIDEKALIQQNFADNGQHKLQARNNIEEKLQQQWQALLNIDNIGIYDNFFELGGHSLLASQAVYQCQQTFGVSIQLSDIITNPCIATVAKAVEQAQHWQAITSAVDNSDDEGEDIVV